MRTAGPAGLWVVILTRKVHIPSSGAPAAAGLFMEPLKGDQEGELPVPGELYLSLTAEPGV